ncbi:transcription antitermination factor NusB [Deltaproteobacteria bacterium TL4]
MRYDKVRFLVVREWIYYLENKSWHPLPESQLSQEQDRRFFLQLRQGLSRHYRLLEAELQKRLTVPYHKLQKTVKGILFLGVYELLFMDKIPHRASVYEAVQLAYPFKVSTKKSLINAVLRNLQADLEKGYDYKTAHPLAIRTSHPDWMVERWQRHLDPDQVSSICHTNNEFDGITLRPIHPLAREGLQAQLAQEKISAVIHPTALNALVLEQSLALFQTSIFQQGQCYIQDASSQIFMEIVSPICRGDILELCAAPGGKTLSLLENSTLQSLVVNDISWQRLQSIRENIKRLRLSEPQFLVSDGSKMPFAEEQFDLILADVPCSSTGTIKKNPDIQGTPSVEILLRQVSTQARILSEAARCLKVKGVLIYSTCSLEFEENELQIEKFLDTHPDFKILSFHEFPAVADPYKTFFTAQGFYKVLPQTGMMGFFAALLEKGDKAAPV